MRRPPPLLEFPRFPVVGGLALLAAGVTIAGRAADLNLEPLYETDAVFRGEIWRFLTSLLPHGDALHLLFNLYWLWVLGSLIEESFGHARTAALIVLLGVGSGAAQFALDGGAQGLSGVGYGLWGFCSVLSRRDERFRDASDKNTDALFIGWFFLCILLTYAGTMAVGNVAHGAGAVFGALVGLAMTTRPRMGWWALIVVLMTSSVFAALKLRQWIALTGNNGPEFAAAFHLAERDRNEEAERMYRQALRIAPKDARAWFNLGILCDKAGRYDEAAECYLRAHQLDPGDAKYREVAEERTRRGLVGHDATSAEP